MWNSTAIPHRTIGQITILFIKQKNRPSCVEQHWPLYIVATRHGDPVNGNEYSGTYNSQNNRVQFSAPFWYRWPNFGPLAHRLLRLLDTYAAKNNLSVSVNNFAAICCQIPKYHPNQIRIWAPFHIKVPIEKSCLRHWWYGIIVHILTGKSALGMQFYCPSKVVQWALKYKSPAFGVFIIFHTH